MKASGMDLVKGTEIKNLRCPKGQDFPKVMNEGELFHLKGNANLPDGLYLYENGWNLLARVQPMVEVGTTAEIDVNASAVIPVSWNKTYILSSNAFTLTGSKIKILKSGTYEIYYNVSLSTAGGGGLLSSVLKSVAFFVRIATTNYIFNRSRTYHYANELIEVRTSSSIKFVTPLNAGEEIELCGQRIGGTGRAYTISDNCTFGIRRIG